MKHDVFVRLFKKHKRILAAACENMKHLMTKEKGFMLKKAKCH
jgi:hypothetical protein